MTQENLGLVFEAMGDRGDEPAGRYAEALACFDAALEVFGAGGMERNRARCARSRARVAGKLGGGRAARRRKLEHNLGDDWRGWCLCESVATGGARASRRARKSKKPSSGTSMNVQSDWPPPEGTGPAPGARGALRAGPEPRGDRAFLAGHDFPLAEPGALTFAWRGRADHVHLMRWIHAGADRRPFVRLSGHRPLAPAPAGRGRRAVRVQARRRPRRPRGPGRRSAEPGARRRSLRRELGRPHLRLRPPGLERAARRARGADRGPRASTAAPSARRATRASTCPAGHDPARAYPLVVDPRRRRLRDLCRPRRWCSTT